MKNRLKKVIWWCLGLAVALCLLVECLPHPKTPSRLAQLPLKGFGYASRDLPLEGAEAAVFQRAVVLKRLYQAGPDRFVLLAVDGEGDRHAIHDPLYCFRGAGWKLSQESYINLPGGRGRIVQLVRGKESAEAMYWITDGQTRHASPLSAWWQSTLRRLPGQHSGGAPVLVVVQPVTGGTLNWQDLLTRVPDLLTL